MALPLVLSLADALLAVLAALMGLGALGSRRQRPEATRVVAAAQRGALDLLAQSAPFGALFLVLFLAGGALAAGSAQEFLTAGLFGAVVASGTTWLAGWQVAQTTARLSRGVPAETVAIELGRLNTVTLLLGGAGGSGLSTLCFVLFPEAPVTAALTGVTAAVGLHGILARPGVLSWAAAARVQDDEGLHAGSLAELVGSTFTGSWLLHTSLFACSALGQVALLVLAKDATLGLGTYALLVPRISLFALACAGLGTRSSSRDGAHALWLRKLVIALSVLGGGAWAAGGVLSSDSAQTWAPALVCYLCASFGFGAWLLGARAKQSTTFVAPLSLLPVLLLVTLVEPAPLGGARTVLLLALATGLALLPLAGAYRVGAAALSSARTCDFLASGAIELGWADAGVRPAPSAGLQTLFLPLALMVSLCAAVGLLWPLGGEGPGSPLVLGLGALMSALLLLSLARRQEVLSAEGSARLAELSDKQPESGGLLLAEGLSISRHMGSREQLAFAGALLGPPLVLMCLSWAGATEAQELAAGAAVAALLWAALAERSAALTRPEAAHAALIWPLALYQLSWSALLLTSFH